MSETGPGLKLLVGWFGISLVSAFVGSAVGVHLGYEELAASPIWLKASLAPGALLIAALIAVVFLVSVKSLYEGIIEVVADARR